MTKKKHVVYFILVFLYIPLPLIAMQASLPVPKEKSLQPIVDPYPKVRTFFSIDFEKVTFEEPPPSESNKRLAQYKEEERPIDIQHKKEKRRKLVEKCRELYISASEGEQELHALRMRHSELLGTYWDTRKYLEAFEAALSIDSPSHVTLNLVQLAQSSVGIGRLTQFDLLSNKESFCSATSENSDNVQPVERSIKQRRDQKRKGKEQLHQSEQQPSLQELLQAIQRVENKKEAPAKPAWYTSPKFTIPVTALLTCAGTYVCLEILKK